MDAAERQPNWVQQLMRRAEGDRGIWMVTLILFGISLITVYSAGAYLVHKNSGGSLPLLGKHTFMLGLGLGAMYLFHRLPIHVFSRASSVLIWVAILLLFLTLLIGVEINDAKRWMRIPGIGITVQTSDFAKIMLITYVARMLHRNRDRLHDFRTGVWPIVLPIVLVCALILPADLSTAALIGAVAAAMLVVGGVPWRHLFRLAGAAVAFAGVGLAAASTFPNLLPRVATWRNRIMAFQDEGGEMLDQIRYAQIAIARGGLTPSGPGTGAARNFVPESYSDMIFASIVEDWGAILGGAGLVVLFLMFFYRTLRAARRCPVRFGSLLAFGLGLSITFQALTNMAVAVRMFPTTGQPIPIVSYGGTSILFTSIAIGMILAVSRTTAPPRTAEETTD